MRKFVGVISAFAFVLVAGCGHTRFPAPDHDEALAERQSEFFAAVVARDAERMAAFFADDAVLHVADMPAIEGRGAIQEFYGNVFRFMSGSRATPGTIQVSDSGDLAYGIGRVINEFRGAEGPVEYAGKYALVWRRAEGAWVVVLYSVSSDQPTEGR